MYFVDVRMKKASKIHKPLHLWSPSSTKGIIFKWTWHPAPLGAPRFYSQPCNRCTLSPTPLLSCTELQVIFFFPPFALLFIAHPSVKVNSMKEGMRGKKPIRGERWDEVWWTGLRREGGDDANQICKPYKKSTDEMALLLWQHTFCSGILGVTLLMQVLQGFEPGLIPNHLTQTRLECTLFFLPLRLLHISILFLAPFHHFGSKIPVK